MIFWMNFQRSTLNAQLPRRLRMRKLIGRSKLNVEYSMFLLLVLCTLPLYARTDTNAPPKLVPAYGEIPETFWEQNQSTVIVAGFAFLAFAFLFLKVMLRPETPVVLPSEVVARQALSKLQSRPEDGKLLSEVSQILRRYIAAAFELSSAEMTTAEFSAAFAVNKKIGPELTGLILSFLRECDERKFSPANATAPFNAATRALELVSAAEKRIQCSNSAQAVESTLS